MLPDLIASYFILREKIFGKKRKKRLFCSKCDHFLIKYTPSGDETKIKYIVCPSCRRRNYYS